MRILVIILLSLALLSGCSSLKVDTSDSRIISPLCVDGQPKTETIVLWGTLWRPNQKEPLLREAMAKQGIEKFVEESPCTYVSSIQQISIDKQVPSNQFIIEKIAKHSGNQLLFILVRELGPTLEIGIPSIVEGHTEVVLEVKVIDLSSHSVTHDSKIRWRQGGKFVIKGTKSLPDDMALALHTILTSEGG